MNVKELATAEDQIDAIITGFADGEYRDSSKGIEHYGGHVDEVRALVPDREPDAISELDGSLNAIHWYELEGGIIIGIYSDDTGEGDGLGYLIPPGADDIPAVKDYRVPQLPGQRIPELESRRFKALMQKKQTEGDWLPGHSFNEELNHLSQFKDEGYVAKVRELIALEYGYALGRGEKAEALEGLIRDLVVRAHYRKGSSIATGAEDPVIPGR